MHFTNQINFLWPIAGIDCNTVGPVLTASGYGSRTLTHSAAYMLESSKDHASALSYEKITPIIDRILPTDSTNFTGSTTPVLPRDKNSSENSAYFTHAKKWMS